MCLTSLGQNHPSNLHFSRTMSPLPCSRPLLQLLFCRRRVSLLRQLFELAVEVFPPLLLLLSLGFLWESSPALRTGSSSWRQGPSLKEATQFSSGAMKWPSAFPTTTTAPATMWKSLSPAPSVTRSASARRARYRKARGHNPSSKASRSSGMLWLIYTNSIHNENISIHI